MLFKYSQYYKNILNTLHNEARYSDLTHERFTYNIEDLSTKLKEIIKIENGSKVINGTLVIKGHQWPPIRRQVLPDLSDIYIKGNLFINPCGISNLKGCPQHVDGAFRIIGNVLKDMQGGPVEVGDFYRVTECDITSLKGVPKIIHTEFSCALNDLSTLEYGPEVVYGDFNCCDNKLTSLEHAPKYVKGNFMCGDNKFTKQQFIDSINTIVDGCYTFSDHIPWDADFSHETIFDLTQSDIKHIVNLKHVKNTLHNDQEDDISSW